MPTSTSLSYRRLRNARLTMQDKAQDTRRGCILRAVVIDGVEME